MFEQMGGTVVESIIPPRRPDDSSDSSENEDECSSLLHSYLEMVEDGEGDLLHAEISTILRLQRRYETRLRLLLERNPALPLVSEGRSDLYNHYEAHLNKKICANAAAVKAATEVLNKWQNSAD